MSARGRTKFLQVDKESARGGTEFLRVDTVSARGGTEFIRGHEEGSGTLPGEGTPVARGALGVNTSCIRGTPSSPLMHP